MGNFIYIDNRQANYKETTMEALSESLNMAIQSASATKLNLANKSQNFSTNVELKIDYEVRTQEEDPQNNQMTKVESSEDWNTIKFHTTTVMKKKELEELMVNLNINKQQIECTMNKEVVTDIPTTLLKKVEIDYINRQIFEIVQEIQDKMKSNQQRKEAFDRLLNIDRSLETHF